MSICERLHLASSRCVLGILVVADYLIDLPFEPKRSFWVQDVPVGATRGFHAHRTGQQILVCLTGRILAKFTDGYHSAELELSSSETAVWMKNMVWGEQTFVEPKSVLLVLASNPYDESDYIRDRQEFELLAQKP